MSRPASSPSDPDAGAPRPKNGRVTHVVEVETPQGPGRLHVSASGAPVAVLVLGHGAGGRPDAHDLVALAETLPGMGITVMRHEQPWLVAGRKVAVRPPLLDEAWLPATEMAREMVPGVPLLAGGRSAGARVACRTAAAVGAVGVVGLSFPLHPPGRPGRSRAPELMGAGVPVLVLQGERDPFGGPDEVRSALGVHPGVELVPVPTAGHDLALKRASGTTTEAWWADQARAVGQWVLGLTQH